MRSKHTENILLMFKTIQKWKNRKLDEQWPAKDLIKAPSKQVIEERNKAEVMLELWLEGKLRKRYGYEGINILQKYILAENNSQPKKVHKKGWREVLYPEHYTIGLRPKQAAIIYFRLFEERIDRGNMQRKLDALVKTKQLKKELGTGCVKTPKYYLH